MPAAAPGGSVTTEAPAAGGQNDHLGSTKPPTRACGRRDARTLLKESDRVRLLASTQTAGGEDLKGTSLHAA